MRLNAKTKRKERILKNTLKKANKFVKQHTTITYKNPLAKVAVVVPFVASDPKQNVGYRAFTAEEIAQAKLDRFTALAMDAQADEHKKYTHHSPKKGTVTSVVVIDSGVNNNHCHKNLAMAIPFMKSQPAMRPLYSIHLRNSPINKRGKLIRPKLIFTVKEKGQIPQSKATRQTERHLVYPQ